MEPSLHRFKLFATATTPDDSEAHATTTKSSGRRPGKVSRTSPPCGDAVSRTTRRHSPGLKIRPCRQRSKVRQTAVLAVSRHVAMPAGRARVSPSRPPDQENPRIGTVSQPVRSPHVSVLMPFCINCDVRHGTTARQNPADIDCLLARRRAAATETCTY